MNTKPPLPRHLLYLLSMLIFLVLLSGKQYVSAQTTVDPDGPPLTPPPEERVFYMLEYGMNLGFYAANRGTANYYNGSREFGLSHMIQNQYYYNEIRQELGYDFFLHGLPGSMKYTPNMTVGFFGSLHFSEKSALIGEFNYVRLRIQDVFTLELDRFGSVQGENIIAFPISGSEERIDLRLGYQHTWMSENSFIHPFFEAGIAFTDTEVKENLVRIYNFQYNIHRPVEGTTGIPHYRDRDYGMGLGAYATLGLKMDVNVFFRFVVGYSPQYSRINLGDNDKFLLNHSIFVRLHLNGLFQQQGYAAY